MPARKKATKKATKKKANPVGRPSSFTQAIGDEICEAIALSSRGVAQLFKDKGKEHWPTPRTFYRWLEGNREFRQQYARAKHQQADFIAFEAGDILDRVAATRDAVSKARERASHRRWITSVLHPRVYGNQMKLSGDADNPLAVTFSDLVKRAKGLEEEGD